MPAPAPERQKSWRSRLTLGSSGGAALSPKCMLTAITHQASAKGTLSVVRVTTSARHRSSGFIPTRSSGNLHDAAKTQAGQGLAITLGRAEGKDSPGAGSADEEPSIVRTEESSVCTRAQSFVTDVSTERLALWARVGGYLTTNHKARASRTPRWPRAPRNLPALVSLRAGRGGAAPTPPPPAGALAVRCALDRDARRVPALRRAKVQPEALRRMRPSRRISRRISSRASRAQRLSAIIAELVADQVRQSVGQSVLHNRAVGVT